MGNSSTLFDRPFQINHIQRSLDAHGFPTTTFLVYHNVIVSVDWINLLFFSRLSFSTDRWVFQVEGLEGLIGPYAVVAAFACEKLGENMTFCQKKKKKTGEEIWKRSMEAIVPFPAIAYLSCLSFLVFFFKFTFLFISLTFSDSSYVRTYCSYEDSLAEEREICWYVWTGKLFFPAIAYFSSVFLCCCCLFVFTLCFNLFNCCVFLWHFQILVSSCVQFLRRRSSRAKKKLRNVWTGKIRFEPRIGAEVEIKYPEKKQTKQQQKQQQKQKKVADSKISRYVWTGPECFIFEFLS